MTTKESRPYAVGDDVRVAVEAPLGVAVVRVVAGEVPDDERLVAAAGEEHVRVLQARGQRGHPAAVAFERPTHDQLLPHAGRAEAVESEE